MKRLPFLSLLLTLCLVSASGCSGTGEKDRGKVTGTVKIAMENTGAYHVYYKKALEQMFPEAEFVLLYSELISNKSPEGISIPPSELEFEQWLKEQKPDIRVVTPDQLGKLVGEGKVLPLDDYIQSSQFPLDEMSQAVVDKLRRLGGDRKLYGLTTEFETWALYYNRDLFEQWGVPAPDKPLTWEAFWTLFWQFENKGVYALDVINQYHFMGKLLEWQGLSLGLQLEPVEEAGFADPAWEPLLRNLYRAHQANLFAPVFVRKEELVTEQGPIIIYKSTSTGYKDLKREDQPRDFMNGRAAMAFGLPRLVPVLDQQQNQGGFDWGVIPIPHDPYSSHVGMSGDIAFNHVLVIPSYASDPNRGWAILEYLAGKQYAAQYPLYGTMIPVYPGLERQIGWSVPDAFYSVESVADDFPKAIYELVRNQLLSLLTENMTWDQAIEQLRDPLLIQEIKLALEKREEHLKEMERQTRQTILQGK